MDPSTRPISTARDRFGARGDAGLAVDRDGTITSTEPLPAGACTIRFAFAYDGGGAGKGGTGRLSVNGKQVAEGRIEKTVPVVFSTDDTFDVGADWGHAGLADLRTAVRVHRHLEQVTIQAR